MRHLILVLVWLTIIGARATATSGNKLILSVGVKSKYGRQFTEVYSEKSIYYCRTELTPYHENSIQPFSEAALDKVRKVVLTQTSLARCRSLVVVSEKQNGQFRKYSGCAESPAFSQLLNELGRYCGRN